MLTGSDLLAKVKEQGDVSKSDLVHACGYVSTKKDGSGWLNFTAFYEALLEAKGVSLGNGHGSGPGKRGLGLGYVARVQFNGNLMVGNAYTAMLDLKPSVRNQAGAQADPPGAGGWGRRGGVSGRSSGRFAVLTPL